MLVRPLRFAEYLATLEAMQRFTQSRDAESTDEIWLIEHPPTYTLGQAGQREHLLRENAIPVVHTDRGGQVTYHGPGQVVAYVLMDLRRRAYFVKEAVCRIEQAVINLLSEHGVPALRKLGAPGVYVPDNAGLPGAKIAALGLKVRNGCTYHGVALNVAMNLAPFVDINPCGYPGLSTTDMASCGATLNSMTDLPIVATQLAHHLELQLHHEQTKRTH